MAHVDELTWRSFMAMLIIIAIKGFTMFRWL